MKKAIVTLACCALIAPLAFAQHQKQTTTTTESVTVTGTVIKMTTEEGAAASYQPTKTLVVREDSSIILAPMLSKALVTVCTRRAKSSKPRSCGCFRLSLRGRLESARAAHSERGRCPG